MPVTGHGPASRTVTRSTRPSSRKSWVMPSFLARIAGIVLAREADLDVDAGGQVVEALQRVDRLGRRLVDVDQALVRADLEVLARVLVLERRADHAVDVLLGGQRNGAGHGRAGASRRLDDLLGRCLDGRGVVGLESYADLVLCGGGHVGSRVSCPRASKAAPPGRGRRTAETSYPSVTCGRRAGGPPSRGCYLTISETTPDPTVRPPSRMANRRPWSMAIGWISSTSISAFSPGATNSRPSGSLTTPVTSVVRK